MSDVKDEIDRFVTSIRSLDPKQGSGGWTYYIEVLGLIEDHRDALRHAEWPEGFDPLEADTHRISLIKVEDELRKMLTGVPLMDDEAQTETMEFFNGLFLGFLERWAAVSEKLGGAQLH